MISSLAEQYRPGKKHAQLWDNEGYTTYSILIWQQFGQYIEHDRVTNRPYIEILLGGL